MKIRFAVYIVLVMMGVAAVVGCGGDSNGGAADAPGAGSNPEQVVQQFVAAIQQLDIEQAKTYISREYMEEFEHDFDELAEALDEDNAEAEFMRELFGAMMNNFEVATTGHTIDGDTAIVNTLNTHPDPEQFAEVMMGKMFEMIFSEDIDFENLTEEEEMELFMGAIIEAFEVAEKVTTESEVPMLREGGQWKINGAVINEYMEDLEF